MFVRRASPTLVIFLTSLTGIMNFFMSISPGEFREQIKDGHYNTELAKESIERRVLEALGLQNLPKVTMGNCGAKHKLVGAFRPLTVGSATIHVRCISDREISI